MIQNLINSNQGTQLLRKTGTILANASSVAFVLNEVPDNGSITVVSLRAYQNNSGVINEDMVGYTYKSSTKTLTITTEGDHNDLTVEVLYLINNSQMEFMYGVPIDTSAFAPKASPVFTGIPTAPTAEVGTNTTQIATTAFVQAAIGDAIAAAY